MSLNDCQHVPCHIVSGDMRQESVVTILCQVSENLELCPLAGKYAWSRSGVSDIWTQVEGRSFSIILEKRY